LWKYCEEKDEEKEEMEETCQLSHQP